MIYQLGPWQFNTELSLLYCEYSEKELDPLTVKLLTYFINHPKAIISRQQLIEDVWQQSFVDDNAINRAMSELRKHLQHPSLDEPLIKTHYRLGYSLILAAKALDINQTTPILPNQKESNAKKWLFNLCSLLVLLALTLSIYWYTQLKDNYALKPDFKMSVIDNGDVNIAETKPLFSHKKDYLAYTLTDTIQDERKIQVRRLSDKKAVILSHPKFNRVAAIAWQNQQDKIVAKGINSASHKCEYLLFDLTDFDGPTKYSSIKPCNYATDGYAALDKDGLFFYYTSVGNLNLNSSALVRFDLKTKEVIDLIPAGTDTLGPELPLLSPDGKRLAYLIHGMDERVQVHLKGLTTLETKLIFQSNYKIFSNALDWVDNDTLRYIDHDQILTFDTDQNKLVQSTSLPRFTSPLHITHKSPTDMYFSTRNFEHYEIKQLDSFNEPEKFFPLFESKQNSHSIQYDNVYQNYYFSSHRSGHEEIWLGNQLGLKQLTNFDDKATKIRSMKVSPNGKHLLYIRDWKQYEILSINTGEIRKIDEIDVGVCCAIWGSDNNSIIYIDNVENHEVKQFDFITRQKRDIAKLNAISLFNNHKGIPFAVTKQSLIDLTTERVYPYPSNIEISDSYVFDQVDEYFYASDRSNKLYRWKNNEQAAEVTHFGYSIFYMDVTDNHELVLGTSKKRNIKIESLSW